MGKNASEDFVCRELILKPGIIKRIRHKFRKLDPAFAEIQAYAAIGYAWGEVRVTAE